MTMIPPRDISYSIFPAEITEQLFADPKASFEWGDWLSMFDSCGIKILGLKDEPIYPNNAQVTAGDAKAALEKREITINGVNPKILVPAPVKLQGPRIVREEEYSPAPMSVGQWRREFQRLLDNPPVNDFSLTTEDGSPIKLEIELYPGKAPFIFTRAYVPMTVGGRLGWFAQRDGDNSNYGWKVILLPKSRDEAIKRLGIAHNHAFVRTIRIVKMAETKKSLLGEVTEWMLIFGLVLGSLLFSFTHALSNFS